jgi:hypothetical protein
MDKSAETTRPKTQGTGDMIPVPCALFAYLRRYGGFDAFREPHLGLFLSALAGLD